MPEKTSTLRIIGGKWRSRKIKFLTLKGVRPTTDMSRETLFNWLVPFIVDANCCDLFAGSGALGFEALSRGAKHVTMIDLSRKIVGKLKENAAALEADNADFYCASIPENLEKIPNQPFDIVFLDPPFQKGMVEKTCNKLQSSEFLTENALIFIEAEKRLDVEKIIPKNWEILRQKNFGMAKIYLVVVRH